MCGLFEALGYLAAGEVCSAGIYLRLLREASERDKGSQITWFFLKRSLRRYGMKITMAAVDLLTTTSLAPAMWRFLRYGRSSSLLISRSTKAWATCSRVGWVRGLGGN